MTRVESRTWRCGARSARARSSAEPA